MASPSLYSGPEHALSPTDRVESGRSEFEKGEIEKPIPLQIFLLDWIIDGGSAFGLI
jgi:hypothetical protein